MAFLLATGGMTLFVLIYAYIIIQQEKKEAERELHTA
jgi:hypothetical protein